MVFATPLLLYRLENDLPLSISNQPVNVLNISPTKTNPRCPIPDSPQIASYPIKPTQALRSELVRCGIAFGNTLLSVL